MNLQPINSNLLPKLKVCGLTKPEQIQELISMRVDFLGFIFYEKSPRYALNHLSLEEISTIDHQGKVGVFVNEEIDIIVKIVQHADLNFVQLHGDESNNFIAELRQKLNPKVGIIKVIRIGNIDSDNKDKIAQTLSSNLQPVTYYLFDTDSKAFGGTGKQFDWNILNDFTIPLPYFLSGGISEENIGNTETLKQRPFALDINSKFETEPGNKDIDRIKKFKNLYQQNR
ncbi:phosphoribosylanthranilate isomerase [Chryseobacterium culicis]|uniref:N-(5'-phosphoribosyl)anthranilate isomerase n=1 Tax=Chryseobacterium culicis TaxID=680127 RepID=A0A2S9CPX6_CHRCI|nr:phosphoribosylanthranilate isomerase [Chryseobacterium culicis]PRB82545.1 phosphoribosylanthranilate isomerase [Chryseobacterium culicis]PRB88920.1 phosphoribosylanthranilate isomerase [Chryseobacterium culicis]